MINLSNNNANIEILFNEERTFLFNYLGTQQKLNYRLHICIREMVNSQIINNLEQSKKLHRDLCLGTKMLKNSNQNIDYLNSLINLLTTITLDNADCKNKIKSYNNLYSKYFDTIIKSSSKLEKYLDKCNVAKIDIENTQDNIYIENTLLISEIDNKVVLPYTFKELNKLLLNNSDKYKTLSDVIDDIYTKPLKHYKYTPISRFREAFKLIREREKGSFAQAIDLALELFANFNLHPAVISACKNLNELDVYLSCLEYNELDDFRFFKTIFKMHPTISTNVAKA